MNESAKPAQAAPEIDSPVLRWALVLMALALPTMGAFIPLWDADTFWHLSAGHFILENGFVPNQEWLSWTNPGVSWSNFEWLSQPLMAWVETQFQATGLQVLAALLVLGCAGSLVWLGYRDGRTRTTALSLLLIFPVLLERLRPRPEIFTWILVPAVVCLPRWPFVPRMLLGATLAWVWTQTHGSWVLFPLFYGLGLCLRPETLVWKRDLPGFFLPLAGLISPAGPAILWAPFAHLFVFQAMPIGIKEWAPLATTQWVWLALAGLWVGFGLFSKGHLLPKHNPAESRLRIILVLMVLASLIGLTLLWGRTAPFLAFALVLLAPRFSVSWQRAIPWLGLLPFLFHFQSLAPKMAFGYQQGRFPFSLVANLVAINPREPVFHAYRFGGLIGLRQGEKRLVFFDGRFFPFQEQLKDMSSAMGTRQQAIQFQEKYQFGWALLDYPGVVRSDTGQPAWDHIFPPGPWLLMDFDDAGKLMVEKTVFDKMVVKGSNGDKQDYRYKYLDPDHPKTLALGMAEDRERVAQEIQRHRTEHPISRRREALLHKVGLQEANPKPHVVLP